MMPKKNEILEKAKELFYQQAYRSGIQNTNTPEDSELVESGFYQQAKSELMFSESKKHEEFNEYAEHTENSETFNVDIEKLFDSNALVLGSRHTGKSDVVMYVSDQAVQKNAIVIVFDPSQDWKTRSNISQYMKVESVISEIPQSSIIYDVSLCSPSKSLQIVENFARKLFEYQALKTDRKQYLIVFEEAHTYFYQNVMKAKASANSVKMLSVGRNVQIACVLVSQFSSMLDKFCVKHATSQIWLGYTKEPNDLRYLSQFLSSEVKQLTKLNDGEFVYLTRKGSQKVAITPYESHVAKTEIESKIPQIEPLKPKQTSVLFPFLNLCVILFFAIAVLSSLR